MPNQLTFRNKKRLNSAGISKLTSQSKKDEAKPYVPLQPNNSKIKNAMEVRTGKSEIQPVGIKAVKKNINAINRLDSLKVILGSNI